MIMLVWSYKLDKYFRDTILMFKTVSIFIDFNNA